MQSAAARATEDGDIHALLQSREHAQAFARLLERYEAKVYRLCCTLLRDRDQAQDAAQESLIRIWKALPGYDGRASLSTWIYAVTRNRCLTAIERRRDLAPLDEEAVGELPSCAAEEPDDTRALLRELVDALPERSRRVLTLFYYEDRSVAEVAAMLAIPEGTVKTLLFRARALLAEQLKRRGWYDSEAWLGASA